MNSFNSKTQLSVDVIAKVAASKITIAKAAKLLNKTPDTLKSASFH